MWQVKPTDRWQKDHKHYSKKHARELAAVLNNLDRYLSLLEVLPNSKCAAAGYLHPEQGGVLAIDQRGGGGNLQETRLYTYAHEACRVLYLITIGNKDSQPADILAAKRFVEALLSNTEK